MSWYLYSSNKLSVELNMVTVLCDVILLFTIFHTHPWGILVSMLEYVFTQTCGLGFGGKWASVYSHCSNM